MQGSDKNYYSVIVRSKKFKPWTIYVGQDAALESFNKAEVRIKMVGQEVVSVPLSQAYSFAAKKITGEQSNSPEKMPEHATLQFTI